MTLEQHVLSVLEKYKYKLRVVKNSDKNLLNFEVIGEDSLYLDTMYKYKNKYAVGIVRDLKTNHGLLVDAISIRELVKHGYICNMVFVEKSNTLESHVHKNEYRGYKAYRIDDLEKHVDNLSDKYKGIVIVDNKLKIVGKMKHTIKGICFNVNSDITHLKVANPVENNLLSMQEFRTLLKKPKNEVVFCVNVESKNACQANDYVLIDHEHYDKMLNTLDSKYLAKIIIKNGNARNIVKYYNINYKIAKIMFGTYAKIALPIPNQFSSKSEFRKSLDATEAYADKFVAYDYSDINLELLAEYLLDSYEIIKNFNRDEIVEYVRNFENNRELCIKEIEPIKNSGESENIKEVEDENIKITDLTYVTDDCDVRFVIKYDISKDIKYIVLVRDKCKNKEIIIPNSEASYEDYLYGNLDIKKIKKSINTILKDFNNSRNVDDILEELGLI